jgi:hypothetical protein
MSSSSSKKVNFDIPHFEYSPNKQEEINNQKEFLKLYYKNNYETILHYTGYVDKNNVLQYYTVNEALRDYDNMNNKILFEKMTEYNMYSVLATILTYKIFKNEENTEKKEKLINSFFNDYNKWKKMLKSKVDVDERVNKKESISKEFSDLNKAQDDYGYYDTNFEGGVKRKYKRKTKKSKKSKKTKRKIRKTKKTRK